MYREPTKAPCKEACPAGVDVPRYLRFIVAGKYAEALAVIRESIPFPAVCGYVCPAPCEIKCQLAQVTDAPEAIRTLKRFVADHASREWRQHRRDTAYREACRHRGFGTGRSDGRLLSGQVGAQAHRL